MRPTLARQMIQTALAAASVLILVIVMSPAEAGSDAQSGERIAPVRLGTEQNWSVRLPEVDKVVYKGELIQDNKNVEANGIHSIDVLYSLAFVTGKYIKEYGKDEELQAEADRVLLPYQTALGDFTYRELVQRGLNKTSVGGSKKWVEFNTPSVAEWVVEVTPFFTLTQDQSAIVLNNHLSIYAPGSPSEPLYKNLIRIVSDPRDEPDPAGFWMMGGGERLKEESANLFARSLEIAWGEIDSASRKDDPARPKTIRYRQGKSEKTERAGVIDMKCSRALVRSLRGWLMSVPLAEPRENATGNECANKLSKNLH
ncbi:hypothetical protein SAMN05216412_101199 [Nitrosospira multiformis]|uniref:Uncharacterized protein n=1 Tax=Nitrosospira multiformis TaxID=1231 RepID=A0A1H9YFD2_9PROT|nr:hypothetical protein [Nitrosospira multiformis]SES67661.1 hypothetical protein SAMN05216412_101199 [Nitrosospira multiformis]